MPTRTLDELQDRVDADLAWRRTEIASMHKQVRSSSGRMQEALTRAGLALLYGHWEGYVKNSLILYVDFVSRRRLKIGELQPALAVLAAQRRARRHGASDAELLVSISHYLTLEPEGRAWFPKAETCVDTRANLSSDRFRDLFMSLGLDEGAFRTKFPFIDYQLVSRRNSIAHGEYDLVDLEAYKVAHTEVIELLNLVRSTVLNSASGSAYRR